MLQLMRSFPLTSLFFLALSLSWMSCGDPNESIGGVEAGELSASPLRVAFPQVNLGETATEPVTLFNNGSEALTIYEIAFEARDGGSIEDLRLTDAPSGEFRIEPGGMRGFNVEFTPRSERPSRGQIRVRSSDPTYGPSNPFIILVDTLAVRPELEVQPPVVRFARSLPGNRHEQNVRLINVGSAPLTIFEAPTYTGGTDFRLEAINREFPLTLDIFDAADAEANPQKYILDLKVIYSPGGTNDDQGEIIIISNDVRNPLPSNPERGVRRVEVAANADAACILVDGRIRNFGQVPIGGVGTDTVTVTNCGSQQLVVSNITVTENPARFALMLGDLDANGDGRLDRDLTLAPGQNRTFMVRFTPVEAGTERGAVVISSNDPVQPELELELVGRGSDGECPVAVAEGTIRGVSSRPATQLSAVPLQYIILDASRSYDPDGSVVSYEWEVLERPQGTIVQLGPTQEDPGNTNQARREFRLFTAGVYKIGLFVIDNEGFRSCEQAVVTIAAIPNQSVHIELTWTNPEDPNEGDDVGSDLDLHLVKMGPGRWFEAPFDIYFANPNRSGEPIWNPEDPSLDIDVTTGAGPENITMDNPADCQWYAVGVHYFREMFGTAFATIRIYINSNLVYERLFQPMSRGGQFWDVARIHWQGGRATVFDVDVLAPASPGQQRPAVTEDMRESGLCTAAELY
jgi:hypothetical protein